MSNIIPYKEMKDMAMDIVKSGFFASARSEAQAITLMMIAQADNIHPMQALMQYDVIGGKPAPKATTILARFQDAGGTIEWLETNDKKAVAKFTHQKGGTITIEWTIERAKQAGLLKNDTWIKYPAQMLRARCIPEGIRAIYPAVLSGMYTSDEVADFVVPTNTVHDEEVCFDIEIEDEEPQLNLEEEKKILISKLKKLNFSIGEIKEFAMMFNISEDLEAVHALNTDETLLNEKIKQYEENTK
jgi:hypothetical protein